MIGQVGSVSVRHHRQVRRSSACGFLGTPSQRGVSCVETQNGYDYTMWQRAEAICPASLAVLICAMLITLITCSKRELRGTFTPSKDGQTYLIVADNNGGHCGSIKVDGKTWSHPIGQAARIDPGRHIIECGGEIEFEIRPGVVFRFDYWGP